MHLKAKRWPEVSSQWTEEEKIFREKPYRRPSRDYAKLFTRVTYFHIILLFGLLCMYLNWSYQQHLIHEKTCNLNHTSFIEQHFMLERSHFFALFDYKPWMVPLLLIQMIVMDLIWVLSANLVVFISMWLKARLMQLQQRLRVACDDDWFEVFCHFKILIGLVENVDCEFGWIIALVCGSRLPVICYMIFNAVRFEESIFGFGHFLIQLVFHLSSTVILFWTASDIPIRVEKIKQDLLGISQLKNFHTQISTLNAVLTGKGMFSLTKGTLLAVS